MAIAWKPSFFQSDSLKKSTEKKPTSSEDVMLLKTHIDTLLKSGRENSLESQELFKQFDDYMQQLRHIALESESEEAANAYLERYQEINGDAYERIISGPHEFDPFNLVESLTVKESQFAQHVAPAQAPGLGTM